MTQRPTPSHFPRLRAGTAGLLLAALATAASAQLPPGDGPVQVTAGVVEPTPVPFDDRLLAQLRVPAGFSISVFAKDLQNVRWLAVAPKLSGSSISPSPR